MTSRGRADRIRANGCRRRLPAQRLGQLRQKQRHAVLDLAGCDRGPRPAANPIPGAGNDRISVQVDEVLQHHILTWVPTVGKVGVSASRHRLRHDEP